MQLRKLALAVLFLSNAGCAEPLANHVACPNISGTYFSAGKTTWAGNGVRETSILREAFKYSLPENVGDPKKYESLLKLKYEQFTLDIRDETFLIKLYDNKEMVYEFRFPAACTPSGWQAAKTSKRYLDGNTVSSHFESIFSRSADGGLVVQTHVDGGNEGADVRAEFPTWSRRN